MGKHEESVICPAVTPGDVVEHIDLDYVFKNKGTDTTGIKRFLRSKEWEFTEDCQCFEELMTRDEMLVMSRDWPAALYRDAEEFLRSGDMDSVLVLFSEDCGSLNLLRERICKSGSGLLKPLLAREALATLLLKSVQSLSQWYLVYGCEQQYAMDFFTAPEKGLVPLLNNLATDDYVPLNHMSDLYGCDLTGVTATPASNYDVYAYLAADIDRAEWESRQKERDEEYDRNRLFTAFSEKTQRTVYRDVYVPRFTPDMLQFEAIVSRWKLFTDDARSATRDRMLVELALDELRPTQVEYERALICQLRLAKDDEAVQLLLVDYETYAYEESVLRYLNREYLYRYDRPPCSYPLEKGTFSLDRSLLCGQRIIRLKYAIPGICDGRSEKRELVNKVYKFPCGTDAILRLLHDIPVTLKSSLAGMEKERGGDVEGDAGMYPRKTHGTHGLEYYSMKSIVDALGQNQMVVFLKGCMKDRFSQRHRMNLAEAQSLYAIKRSLKNSANPVISNSLGIDSTLTWWLVRKVRPAVKNFLSLTGVDYGELAEFRSLLDKRYGFKKDLIQKKTEANYWDIVEQYGWNLTAKGSRKTTGTGPKTSVSEVCCKKLKHDVMNEAIRSYKWDVDFAGIRAEESVARFKAGKRDGMVYLAKSWGLIRSNPILHWDKELVWAYIRENDIPYCSIYDKILYEENEYGEDILDKPLYTPRVGCWCCVLTGKHGYFRWLKKFKPKQFAFMMKDKKLGELLFRVQHNLPLDFTEKGGIKVPDRNVPVLAQISLFETEVPLLAGAESLANMDDFDPDLAFSWVQSRPCKVDETFRKIS